MKGKAVKKLLPKLDTPTSRMRFVISIFVGSIAIIIGGSYALRLSDPGMGIIEALIWACALFTVGAAILAVAVLWVLVVLYAVLDFVGNVITWIRTGEWPQPDDWGIY